MFFTDSISSVRIIVSGLIDWIAHHDFLKLAFYYRSTLTWGFWTNRKNLDVLIIFEILQCVYSIWIINVLQHKCSNGLCQTKVLCACLLNYPFKWKKSKLVTCCKNRKLKSELRLALRPKPSVLISNHFD